MERISFETELGSKYEVYFEKINNDSKNIWSFGFNSIENKGDVFAVFNKIEELVSDKIRKEKIEVLIIYVEYSKLELEKKTNVFTRWIKNSSLLSEFKIHRNPIMKRSRSIKSINTNMIEVNIDKSKL
jgi:hypothetical protein